MIIAMLLAHLVGDYILQWDHLSRWKSQALSGVLVHGSIVLTATLLLSLPFDPNWWPWALFVGFTHTLIDGLELPLRRRLSLNGSGFSALLLFLSDQTIHLAILGAALNASGYLTLSSLGSDISASINDHRQLAYLLGYAFLTMPAWIIVKFLVYGVVNGSAPEFTPSARSKYFCMLERGAIATLIVLGQFIFIPLVALPRLLVNRSQIINTQNDQNQPALGWTVNFLYLAETVAGLILAVAIGFALRQI